jgi:hypothetical protein
MNKQDNRKSADPFDLNRLRIEPGKLLQSPRQHRPKPPKAKKWRRHYVRVPWEWVERLQSAKSISTHKLALLVIYEHWKNGGKPLVLSNVLAADVGLYRQAKWRGLRELETLGLVKLECRKGRAPRLLIVASVTHVCR